MRRDRLTLTDSNITVFYSAIAFWGLEFFAVMLMLAFGNAFMYASEVAKLVIFVPVLLFVLNANVDVRETLRFHRFTLKDFLQTIVLCVCMYIVIVMAMALAAAVIQAMGGHLISYEGLEQIINGPVWFSVLSLVIVAPIFEEFLLRGAILSGHTAKGTRWAVLMSGLIFGLMHGDLLRFFPTAILGCVLAYIALSTNSLWIAVIYHALHNALSASGVMDTYVMSLPWELGLMPSLETEQGAMLYGAYNMGLFIVALLVSILVLRSFKRRMTPQKIEITAEDRPAKTGLLVTGIVLLALRLAVTIPYYFN